MFSHKARQSLARGKSLADTSEATTMDDTINKWETTELEKVEHKAKLLGSIFRGVDHTFMKGTLIKSNNKLAGDAVHSLVNKQKEARQAHQKKLEEKQRLDREQRAREQKQRIQAKLEQKFQLIPRDEIMKIYEECDCDMNATIDELLYLVALTEAAMKTKKAEQEKKEKKAKKESKKDAKKEAKRKKSTKIEHESRQEEPKEKECLTEKPSVEGRPAAEGEQPVGDEKVVLDYLNNLSTAELPKVSAEEEAKKAKELAMTLAKEQFESLTSEEIEAVLGQHGFKLTEQASAALLEATESKQVSVLLHAFDKEIEEWEIREVLGDADWDSAAAALELTKRIEERKAQKEAEEQKLAEEKNRLAKEEEEKKRQEEEEAKRQRIERAQKRLTIRKVNKTELLSNVFDQQIRERQEQEIKDKIVQQQKLDGARQALVKNLQGMFNPNMLMGGPPPRLPKAAAQAAAPADATVAPKVSFQDAEPPVAETTATPTPEDSQFVDHFLEIRKARVVGAKGRRAPSRKPRGATSKDNEASSE